MKRADCWNAQYKNRNDPRVLFVETWEASREAENDAWYRTVSFLLGEVHAKAISEQVQRERER